MGGSSNVAAFIQDNPLEAGARSVAATVTMGGSELAIGAGKKTFSDPAKKAAADAQALKEQQQGQFNQLQTEAKNRSETAESSAQAAALRTAARNRMLSQGGSASGYGTTIMTSPLGITGQAPASSGGGKTLLGT